MKLRASDGMLRLGVILKNLADTHEKQQNIGKLHWRPKKPLDVTKSGFSLRESPIDSTQLVDLLEQSLRMEETQNSKRRLEQKPEDSNEIVAAVSSLTGGIDTEECSSLSEKKVREKVVAADIDPRCGPVETVNLTSDTLIKPLLRSPEQIKIIVTSEQANQSQLKCNKLEASPHRSHLILSRKQQERIAVLLIAVEVLHFWNFVFGQRQKRSQ